MVTPVWHYHNPNQFNSSVKPGLYIKDWFQNCITTGHLLVNIVFPVPGAQKMVNDVTRLHCLVLTSIAIACLALFSWKGPSSSAKEKGLSILYFPLYSPIVLLVGIVLYCILVLCYPYTTWLPHWNKVMYPPPRILGNRPSLDRIVKRSTELSTSGEEGEETDIPETFEISTPQTNNNSTSERRRFTPKINHNNSSTLFDNLTPQLDESLGEDDTAISGADDLLLSDQMDTSKAKESNSNSFVGFTIQERNQSDSSDEDDSSARKKKRKLKELKWRKNEFELPQNDNLVLKTIYTFFVLLVVAYMLIVSWYLINVGFYLTDWNVLTTVVNALCILLFHFFFVLPLFILLISIGHAVWTHSLYSYTWAKKRSDVAEDALSFWKEMEECNYRERVKTVQSYDYKSKRNAYHTLLNMSLFKNKLAAAKKGSVKRVMREVKRGGLFLIVYIIVFFVITNYHTKVNECFNQKNFIYNQIGMPHFDNVLRKRTMTVEDVWNSIISICHKHEKYELAMEAGEVAREIKSYAVRQLRVKPNKEHCPQRASLGQLLFPRKRCQYELNSENEETRNFKPSWDKHPKASTSPSKLVQDAYIYRHADPWQELYSGSIGGYYFIPDTKDTFENLGLLNNSFWIDENTRYVILEFTIFNMNNGIASALRIIYEFRPHGIFMSSTCHSFPLRYRRGEYIVLAIALIVLAVVALHTFVKETLLINQIGRHAYWSSVSNATEFFSAVNSIFLLMMFSYRFYVTSAKMKALAATFYGSDERAFITIQDLSPVVHAVDAISAFMSFIVLFKILKMASYIRRLNVMLYMFYEVFGLFLTPLVAIVGVSIGLLVKFHSVLFYFRSFVRALITSLQFIISPLKIHKDVRQNSSIMGPLLIIVQWVAFILVIVNGFVVAINENFSVKNHELRSSDIEKNTLEATYELVQNLCGVVKTDSKKRQLSLAEEEIKTDLDFNVEAMQNSATSDPSHQKKHQFLPRESFPTRLSHI